MNERRFEIGAKGTGTSSSSNGARVSGTSEQLRLTNVAFRGDKLIAQFGNGSAVTVNLKRYPRLQNANPAQRMKWRLTGRGLGIHWEEVDEDLSVENLLFAAAKSNQGSNTARQSEFGSKSD